MLRSTFEKGEIRHTHRKVYLPTYGMFDEQRYFAAGDRISRLRFEVRSLSAVDLRGSVAPVDDLSGRFRRRAGGSLSRRPARCAASSTRKLRTITRAIGR